MLGSFVGILGLPPEISLHTSARCSTMCKVVVVVVVVFVVVVVVVVFVVVIIHNNDVVV